MKFPRTAQQYWTMRSNTNGWIILGACILFAVMTIKGHTYVDLLHVGPEHVYLELREMYDYDDPCEGLYDRDRGGTPAENDDKAGNHNHDD